MQNDDFFSPRPFFFLFAAAGYFARLAGLYWLACTVKWLVVQAGSSQVVFVV